jgi:hypothetical protein
VPITQGGKVVDSPGYVLDLEDFVPRNTGVDPDGVAETDADHFMKCQAAENGSICATSVRR